MSEQNVKNKLVSLLEKYYNSKTRFIRNYIDHYYLRKAEGDDSKNDILIIFNKFNLLDNGLFAPGITLKMNSLEITFLKEDPLFELVNNIACTIRDIVLEREAKAKLEQSVKDMEFLEKELGA